MELMPGTDTEEGRVPVSMSNTMDVGLLDAASGGSIEKSFMSPRAITS